MYWGCEYLVLRPLALEDAAGRGRWGCSRSRSTARFREEGLSPRRVARGDVVVSHARRERRGALRGPRVASSTSCGRRAADQRVLMKMDIEGVEYRVLPSLLKTGASRSPWTCSRSMAPREEAAGGGVRRVSRQLSSQFEGRVSRLEWTDDTSCCCSQQACRHLSQEIAPTPTILSSATCAAFVSCKRIF